MTHESTTAPETLDAPAFEAPIGAKAKGIASRIEAERASLAKAGALELELRGKRTAALVDGTDAQVSKIEGEIEAAVSAQARIRERIALLGDQLSKANASERESELDALTARAHAARELGEKLIREYASHAAKVGETLAKLKVTDDEIDLANVKLQRANRPLVHSSNHIRCNPGREVSRVVRRKVGINEAQHPYHGRVETNAHDGMLTERGTGKRVEAFVEADVTVVDKIPANQPYRLQDVARLPGIDPSEHRPFWHSDTKTGVYGV